MSHFFTIVLVGNKTDNIEEEVEKLLSPYDENMSVDEYDRECWCVGQQAQNDAFSLAERRHGSINSIRERFWDTVEDKIPNHIVKNSTEYFNEREKVADEINWENFIKEFTDFKDHIKENHPLKDKPNKDCQECNGTGFYRSTYNPESKWDWWVIGGRWDGVIQGKYRRGDDGGFNFGAEHNQLKYNMIKCEDLLESLENGEDIYPFSIVTPKGEWCEKGKMGWFGMSSGNKNKDTWEENVKNILREFSGCIAVGCDLHI